MAKIIDANGPTWLFVKKYVTERIEQHVRTVATRGQTERLSDECRGAMYELGLILNLEKQDDDEEKT